MNQAQWHPAPAPGVPGRDLDDEFVFLDPDGDRLHVLNGVAREIYSLCDGSRSPRDIASSISELYDVEPDDALADVNELLARLVGLGIIAAP